MKDTVTFMRVGCRGAAGVVLGVMLLVLAGCQTTIVPLQPVGEELKEQAETAPATQVATTEGAATQAAATQAATQKAVVVKRVGDPNQTARFVYHANYDHVWRESLSLLEKLGYRMDRQDYRLGVMTTLSRESPQIVEPWRVDQTDAVNSLENTINDQRRTIRITIKPVENKPEFYEVAVQVLVERQTNPVEGISGPIFVEGSAFGRSALSLKSDYADVVAQSMQWIKVGHDTAGEKKILDALFGRI